MIVARFEEVVKKYENKIALKEGARELTYGQLKRFIDKIVRAELSYLRVVPGQQMVGLLFEREIDGVAAVMATLEARQIYVPLDSSYPVKRLQYMLEDSGACMIVTNDRHVELARQLAQEARGDIVVLNIDEELPLQDNEMKALKGTGQQIAYILYTSGSSGKPRGVVQSCENLYFFTRIYIDALTITSADRTTFISSFSHDGAIQDIYSALLSGATLYPFNPREKPVSEILDDIVREKITMYHSVPTVFRYLTGTLTPGQSRQFPGLRLMVTGGEPLQKRDIDMVRSCFPGARLAHMYGQTESSVNNMGFIDIGEENPLIGLGNELEGIELLLLNEEGEEVEEFETGEIFVSSNHIALGYCNDPINTKKAFFYDEELGGIYRTGDLGSRGSNNGITYLGRKDSQVKIRGNRIELSEIEKLLESNENIKSAVVIAGNEDRDRESISANEMNDPYLVAYYIPGTGTGTGEGKSKELNALELRNYLSQQLPDYMIPLYFVEIERIPLSPTGKLDRQQLPQPGAHQLVGHLIRLLRQDLFKEESGGAPAGMEIDILTDEKRKQLFSSGPGGPCEIMLHQLFETHAAQRPDMIAVMNAAPPGRQAHGEMGGNPSVLTYGQLNERANRLARLLTNRGIGANSPVGLMTEPSIEMVVGMLGILKAGGACLALDPVWPGDQVAGVLEENQPSMLLARESSFDQALLNEMPGWQAAHLIPCVTGPRASIGDINCLPFPDRSLVDYETYNRYIGQALVKSSISLQGTRGCPYNCAYCHKIWDKKHRVRSAQNIFSEVKLYYDMGIRRFAFIDDVFNLDRKNSAAFFRMVIENRLNRDARFFFPNGMRGDILTPGYIDLMIEAGTSGAALALETASPRLQELISKNLDLDKLEENLHYIANRYPSFILELFTMHGFPTETEEEAMMTLDFIKRIKWLHFPYINILRIYSNTDMEQLALKNGISRESIIRAENLAFHQLPDTLPFDGNFTVKYQADFLNQYFLLPQRLLQVLPHQMSLLTEDEIVQKYNSYLDVDISTPDDLLGITGISREQLGVQDCLAEERIAVPHLNRKMKACFPGKESDTGALAVLLLDLSQLFTADSRHILYDLVEPPLGLMYVMTYLQQQLGNKVKGKIIKSRVDFDSFGELRTLLQDFSPDVIGIRTLTLQKRFFHRTAAMIREWGINVPLIAGGPYATTNYTEILQDPHVDLAVLGEGEVTFCEIIERIIENNRKLPGEEVLMEIPGIAFVPAREKFQGQPGRKVIFLEEFSRLAAQDDCPSLECMNKAEDLAYISYNVNGSGVREKWQLSHQHMSNLVSGLQRKNLPLAASIVFDSSIEQVFPALIQGRSLYIAPGNMWDKGIRLFEAYKKDGLYVRVLTGEAGIQPFIGGKPKTGPAGAVNDVEKKLLEIWSDVLGIKEEQISVHDNFFELGGHSLRALMVIAAVHKQLDVLIPVGTVLQTPTVKDLAAYIQMAEADKYTSIEPAELKEYYELSSAQERLFVHQQTDEQSTGYNLPKVLPLGANIDRKRMVQAFRSLINRHDSLRTSFLMVGDKPVQKVHKAVAFEIEYVEITTKNENQRLFEAAQSVIDSFVRPFDLSCAPLIRVGLVEANQGKCLLLVDMHHIISDLTTHRLLVRDFMSVYRGEGEGEALPPLKLQYRDYSQWQTNKNVQKLILKQEEYWLNKLSGKLPVLEMPTDYPRAGTLSFAGDSVRCALDKEQCEVLKQMALAEGATMYMVLLAIFYVLLSKLSGQEDIVVGTPVAGRRHADLENIVGIFLNMLPQRNFPVKEKPFIEFLREVKKQIMDAFENQDFPFERLVETFARRDASRNPLFDVMFEFRPDDNPAAQAREMSNEPNQPVQSRSSFLKKTSTLDLILFAMEIKGTIYLNLEYSTRLYKRETATTFLNHFRMIAQKIIENKHIRIKQVELVDEEVKLGIRSQLQEDMEEIAVEFDI